jgi:hypothetical protein
VLGGAEVRAVERHRQLDDPHSKLVRAAVKLGVAEVAALEGKREAADDARWVRRNPRSDRVVDAAVEIKRELGLRPCRALHHRQGRQDLSVEVETVEHLDVALDLIAHALSHLLCAPGSRRRQSAHAEAGYDVMQDAASLAVRSSMCVWTSIRGVLRDW